MGAGNVETLCSLINISNVTFGIQVRYRFKNDETEAAGKGLKF